VDSEIAADDVPVVAGATVATAGNADPGDEVFDVAKITAGIADPRDAGADLNEGA